MPKPRACGHKFLLTKTCEECRRWLEEAKATPGATTITVNPTHGTGH